MSISVVTIAKNIIKQGYCFWESLQSSLPFAAEIIISEGYSDDKTMEYLKEFKKKYDKVSMLIFQDKWEEQSFHGEVITKVSERAIKKANGDWIYYLQADEIIPLETAQYIKNISKSDKYNSVAFPFVHFIRAWEPSRNPAYKNAIRMIRKGKGYLKGDAFTFTGFNLLPTCPDYKCPKPICHFAFIFPKQNNNKDIEHAKLYQNYPEYQEKMKKACQCLNQKQEAYPLGDFDDFPELARRFIGKAEYPLPEIK